MKPGALHANAPWRDVVFVDDVVGARGGEAWAFTLACGHVVARAKPSRDPRRVTQRMFRPIMSIPRRVRCLFCQRITV